MARTKLQFIIGAAREWHFQWTGLGATFAPVGCFMNNISAPRFPLSTPSLTQYPLSSIRLPCVWYVYVVRVQFHKEYFNCITPEGIKKINKSMKPITMKKLIWILRNPRLKNTEKQEKDWNRFSLNIITEWDFPSGNLEKKIIF